MKKQVLKAATMFVGIIALAFASALAANAQNPRNLVVNIPFDFSIKGKTLPAGEYILSRSSTADQTGLVLRRKDGKANAVILTRMLQTPERQEESRLVFNRYGEHYFLSQVWTVGDSIGRELYKGSRERSVEMELAGNSRRAETVTLVARTQ